MTLSDDFRNEDVLSDITPQHTTICLASLFTFTSVRMKGRSLLNNEEEEDE